MRHAPRQPLSFNRKRVPIAPEAAAVNPADETRLRF
jgi:hypothetical protein